MRRAIRLRGGSPIAGVKRLWPYRSYSSHFGEVRMLDGEGSDNDTGSQFKVNATSKTVETAVGELPISPLMDPAFIQARDEHKRAKKDELPTVKKTKFRRILARNPYARALATPFRLCPASGMPVPKFFLQDFNLLSHPETGKPWWVPYSLSSSQPWSSASRETSPASESTSLPSGSGQSTAGPHRATRPNGQSGYFLARQDLLRQFRMTGSRYKNANQRLLRLASAPNLSRVADRAVWREDMDTFVLELMRRRTVEDLVYLSKLCQEEGRKYLIPCATWDEVKGHHHRGSVLWLGAQGEPYISDPGLGGSTTRGPVESPGKDDGPKQFATIDIGGVRYGKKLAVYNLVNLLGPEHLNHLRLQSSILHRGSIFLLGRQRTVDLQLKLWKLQGYLARY